MMGFPSGFSSWLLSNVNFNPVSGLPAGTILLNGYQGNGRPAAIECYARKRYYELGRMTEHMSSGIGHTRIRIREQRQASGSVIFDDWFGTAQIDGEELPFTTNCDGLEADNEYHVVYERTEIPTGEAGIRIHDVIS